MSRAQGLRAQLPRGAAAPALGLNTFALDAYSLVHPLCQEAMSGCDWHDAIAAEGLGSAR